MDQQVPDDWKELVREAVLRSEEKRWLVRGNGKLPGSQTL